ncbi:MAG: proton-conducting transporter membrane subunit [Salinivirgaceae bacterium]|jgi:hydrogenase-4 component B|nr:proton-conducting transporter membrane subunit [Salinivirgaceae bacterium]
MEKILIEIINLLVVFSFLVLPFLKAKRLGYATLAILTIQVLIAFSLVFLVFTNGNVEYSYRGSFVTGNIPIRFDYLSAWFILIISFTFLTGAWYGIQYMKTYKEQTGNLQLHAITYILTFTALFNICIVQNAIVFLVVWELMALGSFILIIFEHYKNETLKAGINFLIQSHVSILFLTISFIWVKVKTGSFDFATIANYSLLHPSMGIGLFVFFFIGFAIKAGFVPFHTWLPLAHPAAPAHISGIMSGVIIKIGIFGILRMLTLIKTDFMFVGYFVLFISVITGLYGVILAIIQHNLKRLLAFHSIENIGIIGMGIGLGCIGLGSDNQWLVIAGFGGALLHTLNHSLFKSLLFFSAGNVYQFAHTMNIESLGGLLKRMPHSAYLFLIGSLAICGLPPFNGFVSEFFIFSGLFKGVASNQFTLTLTMLFSIVALVLIGGLALICFTKAFGIVFLGTTRTEIKVEKYIENPKRVFPLYTIAIAILFIGVMPFIFSSTLLKIIGLFQVQLDPISMPFINRNLANITVIGTYSLAFILLIVIALFIRQVFTKQSTCKSDTTWGCGYTGEIKKAQYTASSFIRTFRKLAEPILYIKKDKKETDEIYPNLLEQVTHPYDKIETVLINKPIYLFKKILNRFVFLQNGNIQSYILYGFIFLVTAILLPILISKIMGLINFLNQL